MACCLLRGDTGGALYENGAVLACFVSIFRLLLRLGGRGILDGDSLAEAIATSVTGKWGAGTIWIP